MIKAEPIQRSFKPAEVEAVLFLGDQPASASPTIAGISLAERALRILLRAHFASVSVVGTNLPPEWARLEEKGRIRRLEEWSPGQNPALLLNAKMAFERPFPRKVVEHPTTEMVTLFLAHEGEIEAALILSPEAFTGGPAREFSSLIQRLQAAGATIENFEPDWICHRVRDREEARQFHRRIENTLIKSSDHMFARWNRRISLPLSRLLAQTPITPNQVTYITLIVAIIGAYFFSRGSYWEMLLGAVLTQTSSVLDGNDGELARLKIQDSDFGTWLDTICDYISYFMTFGSIGLGLYRHYQDAYYLYLTAAFFLGIGIAMPLLSYYRSNHTRKGEAGSFKSQAINKLAVEERRNVFSYVSARLHHFATRATISYFLVVFGLFYWWSALLYFAVSGAHIFWISVLYHSQMLKRRH